MRVIRDEAAATIKLVPIEEGEGKLLALIAETLQPGSKIHYRGRKTEADEKYCSVLLNAGGIGERQVRKHGNGTLTELVLVGGVDLELKGSTEDDKREISRIRDMCFFGTSGMFFLGEVDYEGTKALLFTGSLCQLCGAQMIKRSACEWRTCDACAAKCEHNHVKGAIHGGVDIGVGEYCSLCGRGKPKHENEREKSVLEHHLAVERELGIQIFYEEGPVATPQEAVELNRLYRRWKKAKSRQAV